jgi:gliding motility-associated-like protein
LLVLGGWKASATHIVGGSITYEHLGGATYRVTLKLYRDCGTGNATFPGTVSLSIYRGNGTAYSTVNIPFPGEDTLDPFIDTCAFNPGVCVAQAVYTTVVNNFFPGNGGYHIIYQLCCRNASIDNVPVTPFTPGTGTTYHAFIPENFTWLTNSSPDWVNFPPVFICANQQLQFDHSATDPDGDSLVYNLYRPFEDDAFTWTAGNPNFVPITYFAGYSYLSPLQPSAPAQTMFIDPNTGLLTVTPPSIGQYVVGIEVKEYRNGTLLSTVYRDFQFNVLNCPPPALAGIGPVDACNGTTIQMINASTVTANGFLWDFGDGTPTSTAFEPTHTYASMGTYTITLYAQYGTPCEDVTTQTITISGTTANFTGADSTCVFDPVTFTNTSTALPPATVTQWNWSFGDGTTSTLPNPTHTWSLPGDYTIQLIATNSAGCKDTILADFYAQGLPSATAGPDGTACNTAPLINLNGAISNATGGLWIGQGGTFNPGATSLTGDYTPSVAEITAGFTELILSTTGNGQCPTQTDTLVITYVAGPSVNAGPDQQVCEDTSSVPLTGVVTVAGGGQWTSSSGNVNFLPSDTDLNASYIPSATDVSNGSVTIYLTSILNGNCIASVDSMVIGFFAPPTVGILTNDTVCTGDNVALDANTTTGAGYWTTIGGSGTFAPNDTTVAGAYTPSAADVTAGTVTLVFHSLNNGGCQVVRDTLDVLILDAPTPLFTATQECFGTPTVFTNSSSGPDPIVGYIWQYGDGSTSTQTNPSYTFGTEGTQNVTLIAISQNNCTDTLTQQVEVNYLPDVSFVNSTPCLNGGSQFIDNTVVINSSPAAWDWSFGDGNTSTVQNPLNVYATSGAYTVTLVVTSAQGCVDSATQVTTVLPGPTAAFTASDFTVNLFTDVSFTDQSTPAPNIVTWEWNFGDTSGISTTQNPVYQWNGTGTFPVMLVVTDNNGCRDTLYQDVVVYMPPQVPTGFTPNGQGVNNILYVLGGPFSEFQFNIYNNWGELIFTSTDQSMGWDGTYKGIDQPMGVYVWTLNATDLEGTVHELHGDVTLLR